jgi:ActR/RegA family two-component response regulator
MDKTRARLLLADNNQRYASSLRGVLQAEGWSTDVAYTTESVLNKVAETSYDLCIIDLRLMDDDDERDTSGLVLARDLAQRDRLLRFIILSGYPSYEAIRSALRPMPTGDVPILDFLSKAEGPQAILEAVERTYLARSAELRQIIGEERLPSVVVADFQAIDRRLIQLLKADPYELYQLPPRVFEELIAELLASYGWSVDLTSRTRDGGYDIFAVQKDISGLASSWIIECKRYRQDRKVGIGIVRQLYAVKADLRAGMAMLATTSYFSRDVSAYKASRLDLELRDFKGIVEWINQYRPHPGGQLYFRQDSLILPGDPDWTDPLAQASMQ